MEADNYREKISDLRRDSGSLQRCEPAVYMGAVPAFDAEINGVLEFRTRGIIFSSAASGHLTYIAATGISDAVAMTLTEAGLPAAVETDTGVLVIERTEEAGGGKLAFRLEYPAMLAEGINKLRDDSRKAVPAGDDVFVRLKKLAELKDAGILTEAEFAAKKAELLEEI